MCYKSLFINGLINKHFLFSYSAACRCYQMSSVKNVTMLSSRSALCSSGFNGRKTAALVRKYIQPYYEKADSGWFGVESGRIIGPVRRWIVVRLAEIMRRVDVNITLSSSEEQAGLKCRLCSSSYVCIRYIVKLSKYCSPQHKKPKSGKHQPYTEKKIHEQFCNR